MLPEPKITWYVKCAEDKDFSQEEDFYAGCYNQHADLELVFQIWNNRFGTRKTEDLTSFAFTVSFDNLEDATLLHYCTFELNGREVIGTVNDNLLTIPMPDGFTLSGKENDGTKQHTDNYMHIKMRLAIPESERVKPNDLKSMCFDIVKL